MLDSSGALSLLTKTMGPAMLHERERLDRIDRWWRWDHDKPHAPRQSTSEYKQLAERAQAPWLGLVVTAVAQSLYVEGYRSTNSHENAAPWRYWQANKMDSRQVALHRAAIGYGLAYAVVLPGRDQLTDEPMPMIRGKSPRRMITFYEDETEDDFPAYAMGIDWAKRNGREAWNVRVYDDAAVHLIHADADLTNPEYIEAREHGAGVCPVVRYTNSLDLEARADGEVEPHIPLAGRIDQTTFDRLVVQRFASWVVRTISGMSLPEKVDDGNGNVEQQKLRLAAEGILVAEDEDTKFGSLPATPLDGFIKAHDADIRDLAAITQTPPHHLLGQMANLSAEALAAAEAGLSRKVEERKHGLGESHEQTLRLAAWVAGDTEAARDIESQVRWRDMESRSLAQVADALGKLATMLGVPVEMLWEKIPGWTDQDVERAKALADQAGLSLLFGEIANAQVPPDGLNAAG